MINQLATFMETQEQQHGPFAKHDECPYAPLVNGRCMKCVRPDVGHRCGDGFLQKKEMAWANAHAPYYIVNATWSRITIPAQQLPLFDAPRIEWDNSMSFFSRQSTKRQWWREIHFCKYGRDHSIRISKQEKARRIEVKRVRRRTGCQRAVVQEPYLICS
ncbi:MAG: hypothetical protein IAF02_14675 [Anaerolineae bacterium]|nr:hypothetical protein [Anaerolineae bacterium]